MLNNDNFITIQSFMRNKLGLKGNELLVYAIIYGFSQDGESKFKGSASYIAEWTGGNKRNILRILNKLVEKGLVQKDKRTINGITLCDYSAILVRDDKMSPGVVTKCHRGGDKMSHHNIEDNIDKEKENILKEKESGIKRFIKPTLEQVEEYAKSIGFDLDAQYYLDSNEQKGWVVGKNKSPMKDWKANIRTWKRFSEQNNTASSEFNSLF